MVNLLKSPFFVIYILLSWVSVDSLQGSLLDMFIWIGTGLAATFIKHWFSSIILIRVKVRSSSHADATTY